MQAQGGRIVLYSVAIPCEENRLIRQQADIGNTHPIKLNDHRKFTPCFPSHGMTHGTAPRFESRLR